MSHPHTKQSSLLSGTASMTISHFFFLGTGYLVQIVLASILPPASYGLFGVLLATLNLGELIFSQGILRNVTSLIAREPSKAARVIRTGQRVQYVAIGLVSVVFLLFARQIATALHSTELTPYIRFLALMTPLYGVRAFYASILGGFKLFNRQSFHRIIGGFIKLLAIPAVFLWQDLYAILIAYFVSNLYLLIAYSVEARRWPDFHSGTGMYPLRPFLDAIMPLLTYVALIPFLQSFDLYAVKILLPDGGTSSGYYAGAASLARIAMNLFVPLSMTLLPSLAGAMLPENASHLRSYHDKTDGVFLLTLLPAILLPLSMAGDILDLFFPSSFRAGAVALLWLIASTSCIVFLEKSLLYFVAGTRYRLLAWFILPIIPTYLAALCFLVPRAGLAGAAFASFLVTLLAMIAVRIAIWRVYRLPFPFRRFFRIAFCASLPSAVGFLLPFSGVLIVVKCFLLLILYLAALFLFRALTQEELRYPARLFRPILRRLRFSSSK